MSRNMKQTVEKVFDSLITYAKTDQENEDRIKDIERWLVLPEKLDQAIYQFVVDTKDELILAMDEKFIRLFNAGTTYVLAPNDYELVFREIGLQEVTEKSIIYGCGIIAIVENILTVKKEYSELEIINYCLGKEADDGKDHVEFEIDDILELFDYYTVFSIENGGFQINYQEDFYRIQVMHEIKQYENNLSQNIVNILNELVQLTSSRSVAESIRAALKSKLLTHSYLEIYQCLEYLFIVRRSLLQSKKYSFDLKKFVDFILQENIKVPERKDITDLIRDNVADEDLNVFLEMDDPDTLEREKKVDKVSDKIYEIRCNIAHLKYGQSNIPEMTDMQKMIEKLSRIVLLVYIKMDEEITKLCLETNAWKKLHE